MRCNKEQFYTIINNFRFNEPFDEKYQYIYYSDYYTTINQCTREYAIEKGYEIIEEFNEEVFLNHLGMKTESPQDKVNRLELELNQAKQELEDSKPKVGQWVVSNINNCVFRYIQDRVTDDLEIITDKKLIKKLDNLIEDSFVLPEKWCVKDTKDVIQFFEEYNNGCYSGSNIAYLHYPRIGEKCYFKSIQKGYTEITFEQFKKYVLND